MTRLRLRRTPRPAWKRAGIAMEDEKTRLLAEVQRCRRLAASITNPEVIERLAVLAEEHERRATASPTRRTGRAESNLAGTGEQHGGRRRARRRDGPSDGRSGSALGVVPLGQIEQSSACKWVCLVRQIARPLREPAVELFHDATLQQHHGRRSSTVFGVRVKRSLVPHGEGHYADRGGGSQMSMLHPTRKPCPHCGRP